MTADGEGCRSCSCFFWSSLSFCIGPSYRCWIRSSRRTLGGFLGASGLAGGAVPGGSGGASMPNTTPCSPKRRRELGCSPGRRASSCLVGTRRFIIACKPSSFRRVLAGVALRPLWPLPPIAGAALDGRRAVVGASAATRRMRSRLALISSRRMRCFATASCAQRSRARSMNRDSSSRATSGSDASVASSASDTFSARSHRRSRVARSTRCFSASWACAVAVASTAARLRASDAVIECCAASSRARSAITSSDGPMALPAVLATAAAAVAAVLAAAAAVAVTAVAAGAATAVAAGAATAGVAVKGAVGAVGAAVVGAAAVSVVDDAAFRGSGRGAVLVGTSPPIAAAATWPGLGS